MKFAQHTGQQPFQGVENNIPHFVYNNQYYFQLYLILFFHSIGIVGRVAQSV